MNNSNQIALSLCDYTGNILKPWADAGYRCIAVDIKHSGVNIRDGIEYVEADVREYLPPLGNYAICFAFPPCTHLASSGARWFKQKGLKALKEAIELVEAVRRIAEWAEAPYCIENPVGTLSTYWRKPDFKFNPCDYGGYLDPPVDAYTKATCLWTGNGFVMPEPKPIEPIEGSKMHLLPPSKDRADLRSVTPMGFSRAVFEANSLVDTTSEPRLAQASLGGSASSARSESEDRDNCCTKRESAPLPTSEACDD